ncbi:hypothetical protein B7494_g7900 [Chlorociboria aeruginascens]|nr:hypothetical protein B7494_g7900 [Chlorociboria aeruginascens]
MSFATKQVDLGPVRSKDSLDNEWSFSDFFLYISDHVGSSSSPIKDVDTRSSGLCSPRKGKQHARCISINNVVDQQDAKSFSFALQPRTMAFTTISPSAFFNPHIFLHTTNMLRYAATGYQKLFIRLTTSHIFSFAKALYLLANIQDVMIRLPAITKQKRLQVYKAEIEAGTDDLEDFRPSKQSRRFLSWNTTFLKRGRKKILKLKSTHVNDDISAPPRKRQQQFLGKPFISSESSAINGVLHIARERDRAARHKEDRPLKPMLISVPALCAWDLAFPLTVVESKASLTDKPIFEAENQAAMSGACELNILLDRDNLAGCQRSRYGLSHPLLLASNRLGSDACLSRPSYPMPPSKFIFPIQSSDQDREFRQAYKKEIRQNLTAAVQSSLPPDAHWALHTLRLGFDLRVHYNPITLQLIVSRHNTPTTEQACELVTRIQEVVDSMALPDTDVHIDVCTHRCSDAAAGEPSMVLESNPHTYRSAQRLPYASLGLAGTSSIGTLSGYVKHRTEGGQVNVYAMTCKHVVEYPGLQEEQPGHVKVALPVNSPAEGDHRYTLKALRTRMSKKAQPILEKASTYDISFGKVFATSGEKRRLPGTNSAADWALLSLNASQTRPVNKHVRESARFATCAHASMSHARMHTPTRREPSPVAPRASVEGEASPTPPPGIGWDWDWDSPQAQAERLREEEYQMRSRFQQYQPFGMQWDEARLPTPEHMRRAYYRHLDAISIAQIPSISPLPSPVFRPTRAAATGNPQRLYIQGLDTQEENKQGLDTQREDTQELDTQRKTKPVGPEATRKRKKGSYHLRHDREQRDKHN